MGHRWDEGIPVLCREVCEGDKGFHVDLPVVVGGGERACQLTQPASSYYYAPNAHPPTTAKGGGGEVALPPYSSTLTASGFVQVAPSSTSLPHPTCTAAGQEGRPLTPPDPSPGQLMMGEGCGVNPE